jgi:two-component system, NarL family, response regulator
VADSQIRIMCVDDHRLMREGIVLMIGFDPSLAVVAEAATGEEAVARFVQYRPDVTLMDLQLPGMNGLQAIHAIRRLQSDAKIIVLTMYAGDTNIYHALRAGAMGYLLKDTVPEDLIRIIHDVYVGKRAVPPHLEAMLTEHETKPLLTAREIEVLELLAKGMRNKEIGETLHIAEETARAHIRSIFVKLNVHDRTAALAEALRRGIVRVEYVAPDSPSQ